MMLIEYAGKKLISEYGISIPRGNFVRSPEEAVAEAIKFGEAVLKVQVPAGGRGKAGGVKIVDTKEDNVIAIAEELMSSKFSGFTPVGILVEEKVKILKELYFSFTISDSSGEALFLLSASGGINVEQNWEKNKAISVSIDPFEGIWEFKIRDAIIDSGLEPELAIKIATIASKAYKIFCDLDCRLLEVNPLVVLEDGNLMALDAKLDIDEDAIYRQKSDIMTYLNLSKVDSMEERARAMGLNFVLLDNNGEVGVITGGAGLGMSTIDVIYGEGLVPANFLDLGGGVSKVKVKNAVTFVASLPSIKYIFVNVYGGINNLAEVAKGVVEAKDSLNIRIPIIIKMQGHFQSEAKEILDQSGVISVISPNTRKAVRMLKEIAKKGE